MLRQGLQTNFDEAEKMAAELLERYPNPADQGQIYFSLVQVYGQGAGPPARIIHYAEKALQLPLPALQQSRLYTYLGNATFALDRSKPLPERRQKAATVILKGLAALHDLNLPDKAPDIPSFGSQEFQGETAEEANQRNRREMAAVEKARFLRTMVQRRNILTDGIVWLYSQEPFATEELRKLATDITSDPELAGRLVELVERQTNETKRATEPSTEGHNGKLLKAERADDYCNTRCVSSASRVAIGGDTDSSGTEEEQYLQDWDRLTALDKSFNGRPASENDLGRYEKDVDEIQHRRIHRNKEYYARLMYAACGPLGSGRFNDDRQYELARKYSLSALEDPDAIPVGAELELTGHVTTRTIGRNVPKEEEFVERRRKDVGVRLHAWKRLMDARDPNWDPNERILTQNAIACDFGFPGAVSPEGIEDATLRAKYEASLNENKQKIERFNVQLQLQRWLRLFPESAEPYIIRVYSHPPCNVEELKKSLDDYKIEEDTKARILDAVTKNCDEKKQE